jgi:cytochrome c2
MKARFLIPALTLIVAPLTHAFADDGATLFRNNCGACHTVGKGKLVGQDLKDVQNRHQESWLLKWIKSSQTLVQAGDKDAVKLFADNSSIPMPDQGLSEDEIKSVLA